MKSIDAARARRSTRVARFGAGPRARPPRRARGRRAHGATARSSRFARRFDGVSAPLEVTADEMRAGAARVARRCAARSRQAARNIARVASRQIPKHCDLDGRARRLGRAARRAARARRLLRARRPLSAALVAADDRRAGARRRRPRGHRRLPAARTGGDGRGARGRRDAGCSASAARTRSPRSPTARPRFRAWTRSSGPATATSPPRRRSSRGDCAIDFYAGPDRDRHRRRRRPRRRGSPPISIAQAEHDPDARSIFITWSRPLAERVVTARGRAQRRPRRSSERSLARARRDHRDAHRRARRWRSPTASRPSISSSIARRW